MQDKRATKKLVPVPDVVAAAFTKAEARKFTNEIRADVQALWGKVREAYERRAWAALGYDSFADYMYEEFNTSKAHAYRLLDAGEIVHELTPPPPPPSPSESPMGDWQERQQRQREQEHQREIDGITRYLPDPEVVPPPTSLAQTRELKPLLIQRDEKALAETWGQLVEAYGPQVTGAEVRRAVRARLEATKPPEERLPERLREFNRAMRGMRYRVEELAYVIDGDEYDDDEDDDVIEFAEATPEFIERWREEAQESLDVLTRLLERLAKGGEES